MSGSHGPSLTTLVLRGLREAELTPGFALVVAVSGGPDSMALCHALSLARRKVLFDLLVVSFNHGLRPEAAQEIELVRQFSTSLGLQCETRDLGLSSGPNLQARAREARYKALFALADQHFGPEAFVATAHHAEDRAETLLLRLLRGTSLEGLGVLPVRAGRLLRPMIEARKRDIMLHVDRHGVPWCADPSNENRDFLRVRVRNELLPLLSQLGEGVIDHLNQLAREAAQLEEPLRLNRQQREQLRKALGNPKLAVNLPLGAGLVVRREGHGFGAK